MLITIDTDALVQDIRETFFFEAEGIPKEIASARNAGILTETEFERALITADAALRRMLDRLIGTSPNNAPYNGVSIPENFTYVIVGSQRSYFGRETTLAELIHDALAENVLGEITKNLLPEISQAHGTNFTAKVEEIRSLSLSKRAPKIQLV